MGQSQIMQQHGCSWWPTLVQLKLKSPVATEFQTIYSRRETRDLIQMSHISVSRPTRLQPVRPARHHISNNAYNSTDCARAENFYTPRFLYATVLDITTIRNLSLNLKEKKKKKKILYKHRHQQSRYQSINSSFKNLAKRCRWSYIMSFDQGNLIYIHVQL